jgi:hypothetical protein
MSENIIELKTQIQETSSSPSPSPSPDLHYGTTIQFDHENFTKARKYFKIQLY